MAVQGMLLIMEELAEKAGLTLVLGGFRVKFLAGLR